MKWAQQCASQPPALPEGQKASCPPPSRPREDALTALCFLLLSDSVRCPATREVGEATARAPVRTARPLWCAATQPKGAPEEPSFLATRGPARVCSAHPCWSLGATGLQRLCTLLLGKFPSSFLPSLPLHFPKVPTAPGGRLGPPS